MYKDLTLIDGGKAVDDRGTLTFINQFNFEGVKRFYQVENHSQGFIRAWHGHRFEGKYVYVARGSAVVGAVNLDTDEVKRFVLSDLNPKILYIPPNHANGFMNLEEGTIIIFFSTSTLEESNNDDMRFPYDKWNIWQIEKR